MENYCPYQHKSFIVATSHGSLVEDTPHHSLTYSVGRSPLHTLGNSSCHDMIYGRRTEGRGAEAAAGIEKVWQCLPKRASWARVCEGERRERGNLFAE